MNDAAKNHTIASGVDALIARLREEGTTAGREEADRIIDEAKAQAQTIVQQAEAKAQDRLEKARKEADDLTSAGKDALKVAMRDTVLALKSQLMQRFSSDVERLVSHDLHDEALLRQMILEVVGRVRDGAKIEPDDKLEVVLPEEVMGLDTLRHQPDEATQGKLTDFVLALTSELMREGVSFSPAEDPQIGIRVRLVDHDVTLDLTDEAVAALLLQHLQPRFRAVLDGVIR